MTRLFWSRILLSFSLNRCSLFFSIVNATSTSAMDSSTSETSNAVAFTLKKSYKKLRIILLQSDSPLFQPRPLPCAICKELSTRWRRRWPFCRPRPWSWAPPCKACTVLVTASPPRPRTNQLLTAASARPVRRRTQPAAGSSCLT